MAIADVFEQAKGLSPAERRELAKLLIDTLAEPAQATVPKSSDEHWGRDLNQRLAEIGAIEFVDPDIEDPVDWVNAQRRKRQEQLNQGDRAE